MDAEELSGLRIRAEGVGLTLDDERLGLLAASLREFGEMTTSLERIEVDPTDLALEPFDPAWPDEGRR